MGSTVTVELRGYPGRPLRTAVTTRLGADEHGVWLAADRVVYLIPHRGWWKARHFPDGGWKVDIATPARWITDDHVVLDDLALDVRRYEGNVWVEDEDEFEERVSSGLYPETIAAAARHACDELAGCMRAEPFRSVGDAWLAATPSHHRAALLLDMGGVLKRANDPAVARSWEERFGLEAGELAMAMNVALGPGWEGGREPDEVRARLAERLGVGVPTVEVMFDELEASAALDDRFVRILAARGEGVAAAIVSNNAPDVRARWRRVHDIDSIVDTCVISGEERIAKPDRLMFDIAAWRLGVPHERCVFVDDKLENVERAAALGMTALLHSAASPAYGAAEAALAALA